MIKYLWVKQIFWSLQAELNMFMTTIADLIEKGNEYRANHQPADALKCYATALIEDPNSVSAFNNYGNVIRECGFPERAVPFLQNAIAMAPDFVTGHFNLAVAYLLMGDYDRGWPEYEWRWQYEHLAGQLPKYTQPRWSGQDLKDKTILIMGEQGHGDNLQFFRYLKILRGQGANVFMQVADPLIPLFQEQQVGTIIRLNEVPEQFDYWTPIMSIPGILKVNLDNMAHELQYIMPNAQKVKDWQIRLGLKKKLRVGICWSGRPDSWINQHKAMKFDNAIDLITRNSDYEWFNLQYDCSAEQDAKLGELGVRCFPGEINSFSDTAALVAHLDVVVSVDTAMAHLAGALGRPTWIPLNQFGLDWRWLLKRDSSPWYPSARLFRQEQIGDWSSPVDRIHNHLKLFKI